VNKMSKIYLFSVVLDADCLKGMIFGCELVPDGFSVFLLSIKLLISDSKPYVFFIWSVLDFLHE